MSEYFLWQFGSGGASDSVPVQLLNYVPGEQESVESSPSEGNAARTRGRGFPSVVTFTVPLRFPLEINQTHTISNQEQTETHPIFIVNIEFSSTFYGMQKVVTAYVVG